MNRVLVALSREAAESFVAECERYGADGLIYPDVKAALDTDREQQVGRLVDVGVKALEAVATGMHVNSVGGRRQQDAAAVVDAVLSTLEQEGDTDE